MDTNEVTYFSVMHTPLRATKPWWILRRSLLFLVRSARAVRRDFLETTRRAAPLTGGPFRRGTSHTPRHGTAKAPCATRPRPEVVLQGFGLMQKAGLTPDAITYSSLIIAVQMEAGSRKCYYVLL